MIPQAHHRRVIVIMTATLRTPAVAGRLRAGLVIARGLLARGLLTGLLEAGLFLVQHRLLRAGLTHGARGAGRAILAGGAGRTGLADLAGLLVRRLLRCRLGAGEAFGPCG